jgi:hypothetical protein
MMKNPITLNFLLFIGFLVIGYSVSTKFYHSDFGEISNASILMTTGGSKSIQSLNNGQRNILLIGVNTINASEAQLESLWLVTNLSSDSILRMLPIFPSGNETISDFEYNLYRSFKLEKQNGNLALDQQFIRVLEENNYWWSGYFVIDHVAMKKFMNLLGKADDNGEIIYRVQLIEEIPEAIEDPKKAFSIQLAIMQIACQRLAGLSQNPDLSQVIMLSPTHLLTDLDLYQFRTEWKKLFSDEHNPNCMFPTLEQSWIDN